MLIAGSWEIIPWEGSLYSCLIFSVLSLRVNVRARRLWSFDLSSQAGHRSNNSYKPSVKINMNTLSAEGLLPYSDIIWSLWPFKYCSLLIVMKISMYLTCYKLWRDHSFQVLQFYRRKQREEGFDQIHKFLASLPLSLIVLVI